jgi:hypothetical protein
MRRMRRPIRAAGPSWRKAGVPRLWQHSAGKAAQRSRGSHGQGNEPADVRASASRRRLRRAVVRHRRLWCVTGGGCLVRLFAFSKVGDDPSATSPAPFSHPIRSASWRLRRPDNELSGPPEQGKMMTDEWVRAPHTPCAAASAARRSNVPTYGTSATPATHTPASSNAPRRLMGTGGMMNGAQLPGR